MNSNKQFTTLGRRLAQKCHSVSPAQDSGLHSDFWRAEPTGSLYPWVLIHADGTRLPGAYRTEEALALLSKLPDRPDHPDIEIIVDRVIAEYRSPDLPPPGEWERQNNKRRKAVISAYRKRNQKEGK